jgi:Holliday junction resolvase
MAGRTAAVTTNYAAGSRLEYRAMELLRRRAWFVVRSAGSHGPADLVALSPTDGHAILVQCKTGSLKHEDWNGLRALAIRYHATPLVAAWNETRRKVLWLIITGDHVPNSHGWPAIPYDLGREAAPALPQEVAP